MNDICARKGCDLGREVGRYCPTHHSEFVAKSNATKKSRVLLDMGKPHGHSALLSVAHRCTALLKEWEMLPPLDGHIRCLDCSDAAVYWDHRDYCRPFDVVPVCAACNVRRGAAEGGPHREDYQLLWDLYSSQLRSSP